MKSEKVDGVQGVAGNPERAVKMWDKFVKCVELDKRQQGTYE